MLDDTHSFPSGAEASTDEQFDVFKEARRLIDIACSKSWEDARKENSAFLIDLSIATKPFTTDLTATVNAIESALIGCGINDVFIGYKQDEKGREVLPPNYFIIVQSNNPHARFNEFKAQGEAIKEALTETFDELNKWQALLNSPGKNSFQDQLITQHIAETMLFDLTDDEEELAEFRVHEEDGQKLMEYGQSFAVDITANMQCSAKLARQAAKALCDSIQEIIPQNENYFTGNFAIVQHESKDYLLLEVQDGFAEEAQNQLADHLLHIQSALEDLIIRRDTPSCQIH